jgi:hypothetical protein
MANPDVALSAYLRLAVISHERGQWLPRNKFLILAGDAACREGLLQAADHCRDLILTTSPAHIIGRYDSFPSALKSAEFQTYLKQLKKFCSVERAEHLLEGQGEQLVPATRALADEWLARMSPVPQAPQSSATQAPPL